MATAYAVSASSLAQTVLVPRPLTTSLSHHRFGLPQLPLRRTAPSSFSASFKRQISDSKRWSSFKIKASSEESSGSVEVGEVFSDLKEKWDAIEDKTTVVLYGGGAVVAVWLSVTVVGAINSVPVLPKFMELVGLGYTGWFVYRYLLFKMWWNNALLSNVDYVWISTNYMEFVWLSRQQLRGALYSGLGFRVPIIQRRWSVLHSLWASTVSGCEGRQC